MMIKKILMLGLVLVAALSTMSALSATNNTSTPTAQDGTITLENLNFKIPTGFNQVERDHDVSTSSDSEDISGCVVDRKTSADFRNANGEKLDIKVGVKNNGPIDTINLGTGKKTINGKEGYFWTETDDGRTEYKFQYINDGKVVKIETNNEALLKQVVA